MSRTDEQPLAAPATAALVAAATHRSTQISSTAVSNSVLDTVAVAIGAADEPAVRLLREQLIVEEPATGPAAFWGSELRLPRTQAALLNGTAAHALDWDDASPTAAMHPSAVIVPAVLAAADETATPLDLIDAVDAGNAVFRAVSEAIGIRGHMAAGWHNTATTGRLATTVAVARIARLDAVQTARALGIAASFTAGSLANFGTMTKPLHAGATSRDAVFAVQLARRGFDANAAQLDDPRGFFTAFGPVRDGALDALGERVPFWREHWQSDQAIKVYPSCFGTHRAIDAALDLRPQVLSICGGDLNAITEIDVRIHPGGRGPLLPPPATTGLQGKFSLEYTVARALLDGRVDLGDFTDARVNEPTVQRLASLVHLSETAASALPDGDATIDQPYARVRIAVGDHHPLRRLVLITRGDARNPLDADALIAKATAAMTGAGHQEAAAQRLAADLAEPGRSPAQLTAAIAGLTATPAVVGSRKDS